MASGTFERAPCATALIGIVAIAAWGCGPSPAELHFEGALASHPEARLVLVATKQKERIRASLLEAGLRLSDEMLDADFYLRVTVGNEKAFRVVNSYPQSDLSGWTFRWAYSLAAGNSVNVTPYLLCAAS